MGECIYVVVEEAHIYSIACIAHILYCSYLAMESSYLFCGGGTKTVEDLCHTTQDDKGQSNRWVSAFM